MSIVIPRGTDDQGNPIWDSTDELYVTYDGGSRATVKEVFDAEAATSAPYEAVVGLNKYNAVGRLRPGWYDIAAGEHPPVQRHPEWDDTGTRLDLGTFVDHGGGGESDAGAIEDSGYFADSRRLPIRSHRHCPGCIGHERASGGFILPILKLITAWVLGWFAIHISGVGLEFKQYVVLVSAAILIAGLTRPMWREYVAFKDFQTNGGRR
jgi:hypothetical protein